MVIFIFEVFATVVTSCLGIGNYCERQLRVNDVFCLPTKSFKYKFPNLLLHSYRQVTAVLSSVAWANQIFIKTPSELLSK